MHSNKSSLLQKLNTKSCLYVSMSQITPEEAELAFQEIRFLKQTILSLRNELEKSHSESLSSLETKTIEFSREQKVLKKIIEKQREEKERLIATNEEEKAGYFFIQSTN